MKSPRPQALPTPLWHQWSCPDSTEYNAFWALITSPRLSSSASGAIIFSDRPGKGKKSTKEEEEECSMSTHECRLVFPGWLIIRIVEAELVGGAVNALTEEFYKA